MVVNDGDESHSIPSVKNHWKKQIQDIDIRLSIKLIFRYIWWIYVNILIANVGKYSSPMDFGPTFCGFWAPQRHLSPCCRKRSVCGKMAPKKPRWFQTNFDRIHSITRIYSYQVGPKSELQLTSPGISPLLWGELIFAPSETIFYFNGQILQGGGTTQKNRYCIRELLLGCPVGS